ncbi:CoA-transferase family III domain-containing protein, partial [Amylostereum chailletii]
FPPGRPANDDDAAPVRITKIGEAPRREVGSAGEGTFALALEGIRVLDLTRVLAGPVCGRTLAAHGADVLWITSPDLPSLPFLDADTSRGKRTTQLDLNTSPGRATLRALAEDADVFLQAYRPGGLAARGFGPEDVANMRPGIVYASLSAYPEDSLWKDVRGFDSLVQTLSGFNVAEAQAYAAHVRESEGDATRLPPFRALPMQALDHAAGYLLAFGIASALGRTITEGGSWKVHVSLYATMRWIRALGTLDPVTAFGPDAHPLPPRVLPLHPEVEAVSVVVLVGEAVGRIGAVDKDHEDTVGGTMTCVRHAARMEKTPVRAGVAPRGLDAHRAGWLSR